MANRATQTIELFGKPENIKEVFDYIINEKTKDFEGDNFGTTVFPNSLTSLDIPNNKIILETNYAPVGFKELSEKYPNVGFKSYSFTNGVGIEEVIYVLNGSVLYSSYIEIEGPFWWKTVTGNEIKSVNDVAESFLKMSEKHMKVK